ncbi:hypothetical protein M3Y99_01085300 [Aphelenchoides fujianensis]|nr:hypothetical protein M3Y99_01085300 [Aphelenchoides fujianensis]
MEDHGPLFAARPEAGGRFKSRPIVGFARQVGPTCGLVGVQIAARAIGCERIPTVDEQLEFARSREFSEHGECFSVDWMREMAAHFLPPAEATSSAFPSASKFIEVITNGGVLLVPYDSDRDFGPCTKNGRRCSLTGVFFLDPHSEVLEEIEDLRSLPDLPADSLFLIGYQGKSTHAGLWPLRGDAPEQRLN